MYTGKNVCGRRSLKTKKEKILLIGTVCFIVIFPVLVAILVSIPILDGLSSSNDWIGFWGGYIGSLLGGVITLYVLIKTLESAKEERIAEEKSRFFKELIDLVLDIDFYQKRILKEQMEIRGDKLQKIMEYNALISKIGMLIKIEKCKGIYNGIDELEKIFEDFSKVSDEFVTIQQKNKNIEDKTVKTLFNSLSLEALYETVKNFVVENSESSQGRDIA